MNNKLIQSSLETTLKAQTINIGPSGDSGNFSIASYPFNFSVSQAGTDTCLNIKPATETSIADIVNIVFADLNFYILEQLVKDAFTGVDLTEIVFVISADVNLGPTVSLICTLQNPVTFIDGKISLKSGAQAKLTSYVSKTQAERFINSHITLTGIINLLGVELNTTVSTANPYTWTVQVGQEGGTQFPDINDLAGMLGESNFHTTLGDGLGSVGMSDIDVNWVAVTVDFKNLLIVDLLINGAVKLGASASIEMLVDVAQKTVTGNLSEPAEISLSDFIPGLNSQDFIFTFPSFSLSFDLEQKSLQLDGCVKLNTGNDALNKIASVFDMQNTDLSLSLYIAADPFSFVFSCVPNASDGGGISIHKLLNALDGNPAVFASFPDLTLTLPSIVIKKLAADFSIQTQASIVGYGSMMLIVDDDSDNGLGFGIGVDYSEMTDLATVIPNLPIPLPDFIKMPHVYLVFSSINQDFSFSAGNEALPPINIKQDSIALGSELEFAGKAGGFVDNLLGGDLDLFLSGAINFKNTTFSLSAEIDISDGGIQIPFNSDAKCLTITFQSIGLDLILTEDNFIIRFDIDIQVDVHQSPIDLSGQLIFSENEFDIAATMTGAPIVIPLIEGFQFEFNNIAFELGDGYELADPTVGFTGEVTFSDFNGMAAFMMDSGEPQNMMIVASMNELPILSLGKMLASLCAEHDKSLSFLNALNSFDISGTKVGDVPASDSMIQELNQGKLDAKIEALINAESFLITQGKKGSNTWFVTNNDSARIYQITLSGPNLVISNELQIYVVALGPVYIGKIEFEQGFRLNGALKIFDFEADVDIAIETTGISCDAICSPVDFNVIKFTKSTTNLGQGPSFSLSTGSSNPHFNLNGYVSLLGIGGQVEINISEKGISCESMTTGLGIFKEDVSFISDGWTSFTFHSKVELDMTVSIPEISGPGGVIIIPATSAASGFSFNDGMTIHVDPQHYSVHLQGALIWQGTQIFSFSGTEDIQLSDLKDLESAVVDWIEGNAETVFADFKKDAKLLLGYVKSGLINLGNGVANVLRSAFNMSNPNNIAAELKGIFGNADIVKNLHIANFPNQQIAGALQSLGLPAADAITAIKTGLGIDKAADIASLLTNAGFKDVDSGIDSIFGCSCYLQIKCAADCPVDCPGHCAADCPADCPGHCIAHQGCPVHCVVDCPAHCLLDCPLHGCVHL